MDDEDTSVTMIGDVFATCAQCGASLDDGEWHPVVEPQDEDENALYSFYDADCRSTWVEDRETEWGSRYLFGVTARDGMLPTAIKSVTSD